MRIANLDRTTTHLNIQCNMNRRSQVPSTSKQNEIISLNPGTPEYDNDSSFDSTYSDADESNTSVSKRVCLLSDQSLVSVQAAAKLVNEAAICGHSEKQRSFMTYYRKKIECRNAAQFKLERELSGMIFEYAFDGKNY